MISLTPLKAPSTQSKIAIVGMSGRFPGGANLDAFWDSLEKGLDLH